MKSKVKKRCKQMLTGLLALSMLCGLLPQNTVNVSAATTAKTTVSSYGRLGTVDVGSKTKSGTWWKINVGSKTAFCLSLGKTCHTGNTYQVTDTHTWNQNTGGEKHGYYAKIIRFYVNDCNRAKKAFVLGQALIWAVSEGNTSEANLKNVIKQVKANTGYFPNKTVADLYKQIFQPSGTWEAKATMWEKTGATKGYQKLITVDADILQNPNYKTITDHTYYRQRITLHKQDEDGKGLGGIKFTLSADNLDDLYSFNVFDRNGDTTSNADEDDNTEFEVSGLTTDGGTVAWRMTYRLEADEMAYYTDAALANMNADQKKAAKEALEDDGYKQGVHFGKNMTKAEADGYVTADAITYQIKSVMASSVAENPTYAVASGSAVAVNPVSGSAVSGETGISYTSVVAVKQKDGTFADHTDDKIIMVDEQTHIQLLKLDKETGQALGGAKFVVTDSKGNKVMKFVTKDDAYDIIGKLVVGETYTFTEVSAPSGYQLAKPVQLTIKDTGKVQTVTVKDASIPEVPDTPQTGGNMPIIPIAAGLFMVVGAAVMIWKRKTVVKR